MSCAASTFSREHILLWLPCRSHCQRSGELPSREQMPSCVREGLAWSPLSAATPLKQVLIHFGRHWVELCVAKNSFPDKSSESIPSRGWDWPHVYIIPSVPHTVQLWVLEISDRMGNSGLSIFLGIRPEILYSASSNSHVTWGSGRRLLVWRGLSTHEGKKVQFLLLWKATELVTQKQGKQVGCTRWRQPDCPPRASSYDLISEVATRMTFYGSQIKLLRKILSASPDEQ